MDVGPGAEGRGGLTAALIGEDILDLAYDAVITFRLPDQAVLSWNRGAEEMYGWTEAEALGRPPQELLRSDFGLSRQEVIEAVQRDGRWSGTIIQTRRDGRRVIADARWAFKPGSGGEPPLILEVNRDLTEQELADERFRLVVESLRDYAIFMLDRRRHVVRWNAGATALTGWGEEEVVGRPLPLRGEDDAQWMAADAVERAERAGRWVREGWLLRKDGSRFYARVTMTPLQGPAGLLHGFAVILQDDTAKHELEASRENFVNFAAHEMRAPVTLLHGYLSMLEGGDIGADTFRAALPTIVARVHELQLLIEQMIESSRLEQGRLELKLEEVDLRAVAAELVELASRLTSSRHRIRLEVPEHEVWVIADPLRARSVIRNLLDNAVKYSPAGGEIVCRVTQEREWARCSVSDPGIGIRAQDLHVIFARYGRVRTQETRGITGTGLGLYMSRELARLMHGDITVSSAPGQGSTFTLSLPLSGRAASLAPTIENAIGREP